MIASLHGRVASAGLDRVVVDVGGVGLLVNTTPATAAAGRIGQDVDLSTTLVVREDSLTLYGFATADERDMFETVQKVTGVGPRLALAMLAVLTPDTLRAAVATGDIATLTKVPGVGKKVGERLALELRDKLGMPTGAPGAAAVGAASAGWRDQVTEALVGLGWSAKQAADAVDRVAPATGPVDIAVVLRNALRELGR